MKDLINQILQEVEHVIEQGDHLICKVCGREVTVTVKGKGPLICHGQPMEKKKIVVEVGFKKMPKGWDKDSVKKFAKTLTKEEANVATKKGFFDKCVKKMSGKVENPEGFCAAIKDEAHGGDKAAAYWRGKGKDEEEAKQKVYSMRAKFKNK